MKVIVKAYAKINLMLDIVSKRKDGYHDLFMIMQSVGIYDTVNVEKTDGKQIRISSNVNDIPLDERNIAYKAADAFFKANSIKDTGITIHIVKRIPHAAGLAGGSADGAAVIAALNQLYGTELSDDELCKIGVKVGADVPFCLTGGTLLSQGIGDVLSNVKPLRKCYIVLAKPAYSVNTGSAYSQFDTCGKVHTPDKFGMLCAVQSRDLQKICDKMENVFEQFIEVPNRIDIKQTLRENGAMGVCMSGSGPTIFGIFDDEGKAVTARNALKKYTNDLHLCRPVSRGLKIKIENP